MIHHLLHTNIYFPYRGGTSRCGKKRAAGVISEENGPYRAQASLLTVNGKTKKKKRRSKAGGDQQADR